MEELIPGRLKEGNYPNTKNLPEKLTMDSKLIWFCEPRDVGAEYGGIPLKIFIKAK